MVGASTSKRAGARSTAVGSGATNCSRSRRCAPASKPSPLFRSAARPKTASFTHRLARRDGRRDGLHWPEQDGPGSFVGPLLAAAEQPWGEPEFLATPFHGYFYRVLDRQGPQAPGGVRSYRADAGALQRGFALLAWPAEYGKSGISTFLVDQHGIVLERDLGRDTKAEAAAMLAFDPGEDWRPTDA